MIAATLVGATIRCKNDGVAGFLSASLKRACSVHPCPLNRGSVTRHRLHQKRKPPLASRENSGGHGFLSLRISSRDVLHLHAATDLGIASQSQRAEHHGNLVVARNSTRAHQATALGLAFAKHRDVNLAQSTTIQAQGLNARLATKLAFQTQASVAFHATEALCTSSEARVEAKARVANGHLGLVQSVVVRFCLAHTSKSLLVKKTERESPPGGMCNSTCWKTLSQNGNGCLQTCFALLSRSDWRLGAFSPSKDADEVITRTNVHLSRKTC